MDIIISASSGKPIHEQVSSQVKALVMNGSLAPNEELPSIRGLAKLLGVSVITVQRAYGELQREGFIDKVVGRGSFVTCQSQEFYRHEQQRVAEQHLAEAAQIGRDNDIPLIELTNALQMFYEGAARRRVQP